MAGKKPRDMTPDIHAFQSPPESTRDLVNMYGTYNIQRTCDTENTFPLIAQGLPKAKQDMHMGKDDLKSRQETR